VPSYLWQLHGLACLLVHQAGALEIFLFRTVPLVFTFVFESFQIQCLFSRIEGMPAGLIILFLLGPVCGGGQCARRHARRMVHPHYLPPRKAGRSQVH